MSLPEDDAYDYAEDRRATELLDGIDPRELEDYVDDDCDCVSCVSQDDARVEKTQVVEQRLGTWGVDNHVEPNW